MNNYEVTDVFEVGDAGILIRDKQPDFFDEIAGPNGVPLEEIEGD